MTIKLRQVALLFLFIIASVCNTQANVVPEIRNEFGTIQGPPDGLNIGEEYTLTVTDLSANMLHPTQGIEAINGTLMPMDLGFGYSYVGTAPILMSDTSFVWKIIVTGSPGAAGLSVDFLYYDDGTELRNTYSIWTIAPTPMSVTLLDFEADLNNIIWQVTDEHNLAQYELEVSADGKNFNLLATIEAEGKSYYGYAHKALNDKEFFRLKMMNTYATCQYSKVIQRSRAQYDDWKISNPIRDVLSIYNSKPVEKIELYNLSGHLVKSITDLRQIDVSSLSSGVYILKLTSNSITKSFKILKT